MHSKVNSLQKDLQKLKQQKSEPHGDLLLSDDIALLMQESPLISQVIAGDQPYTSVIEEILREQAEKLGLDVAAMTAELQKALDCDGFLISSDMSPRGRVMSFIYSQRMGPATRGLYDALMLTQPLTDDQKLLLERVCQKMGQPDWPEIIEEETAAREQEYAQNSPATDDNPLASQGGTLP